MALALASALIAGCGHGPVAESGVTTPATAPGGPTTAPAEAFEARHLRAAQALEAEGRWGEAAARWEALSLLAPGNAAYRRNLDRARGRARAEADARVQAAETARKHGDVNSAYAGYLNALVADPEHAVAADRLRELEFERNRRLYLRRRAATPADGYRPPKPNDAQ